MNVIIIDDEAPARQLIKHYLQNYPNIVVVGEADNGFDGIKLIKELEPQLLFLDVQMPKLTGFEMLELLDKAPQVIFSTAYDQYAIRAFEQNAIDYLLKPYSQERFDAAVQKAVQKIESADTAVAPSLPALPHSDIAFTESLTRIAVKRLHQIHIVPVDKIDYIEANADYVNLHTDDGVFLKEKTMKYFESNLPQKQFVRIHRSFIANVERIVKIELYEKEKYHVHLRSGSILNASNSGYKLLREIVKL
ncbi:DNA-binding response regulator [Bacteroidia bacterium]|nr:DNA-binding response regulator [Bacteroidia bacterium]